METFLFFVIVVAGIVTLGFAARIKAHNENLKRAKSLINTHAPVLARKKSQLAYKDDYGNLVLDDWHREVMNFYRSTVFPRCGGETVFTSYGADKLIDWVEDEVIPILRARQDRRDKAVDVRTPTDYEHECARLVRLAGWNAQVTGQSGDQGCDIVATSPDGIRMVIQCKYYSSPAGNKSVQEVIAAKEYYKADAAMVISSAGFTKSARQLAASAKVAVIHHDDIHHAIRDRMEQFRRPLSRSGI